MKQATISERPAINWLNKLRYTLQGCQERCLFWQIWASRCCEAWRGFLQNYPSMPRESNFWLLQRLTQLTPVPTYVRYDDVTMEPHSLILGPGEKDHVLCLKMSVCQHKHGPHKQWLQDTSSPWKRMAMVAQSIFLIGSPHVQDALHYLTTDCCASHLTWITMSQSHGCTKDNFILGKTMMVGGIWCNWWIKHRTPLTFLSICILTKLAYGSLIAHLLTRGLLQMP